MENYLTPQERKNKRKGLMTSLFIHVLLILLALLPLLTFPDPPPGQEGILVNLGLPDQGQGTENAGPSEPVTADETLPEPEETEPEEESQPQPEVKQEPEPVKQREVVQSQDPNEIALKKEKARQEELERQRREEEIRKQRAEEEARKRAEEEARRKQAEEEARKKAEADKLKSDIGGLFGEGKGKGQTGKPGNQGDPGGDPNATKLEGISTGSGTVGGGLGDRGVARAPKPEDSSQKQGTVVISVCVDKDGNIISANYTQRGSTTADAELVRIATNNAKQWKFSRSDVEKQCGTITYNFRLR